MAGSISILATAAVGAFWAGLLLALRSRQLLAAPDRPRGFDAVVAALAVPFLVAAGALAEQWGVETVLMLGSCLAALAFIGLERGNSLMPAFGTAALFAGAIAALLVGSILIMPRAFFPEQPARSLNLGFVVIALGGLGGGRLVQLLTAKLPGRKSLLVLAMASLAPALCVAFTPVADFGQQEVSNFNQILSDPRLILLLVAAALCFPLDALLGPWIRRFVQEHAYRPALSTLLALGFWAAFLGSRLMVATLLPVGWEHIWIVVWAVLALVTISNMVGAYAPASNVIGPWVTAACCAPLVPTLLGLALQRHADCAGWAIGLVCAAGMLGNLLVLPWVDASLPDHSSRTALRGATVLAVALLVPVLVLAIVG